VSWSLGGNILAVSAGDNITRIIKETPEGEWEVVNFIKDNGQVLREVGE
jgi:protein transport protein SEC13